MTCHREKLSPDSCLSECFLEVGSAVKALEPCTSASTAQSFALPAKEVAISCSLKRKRPPKIQIPHVLKEIKIDTQFDSVGSPAKNDVESCFGDLGVGFSSVKGKKKFMEDAHKIIASVNGDPKKGFFGVYDGHGGRKAAEFVAECLHKNVLDMLANREEENIGKEEAVKAAYLRTDKEFLDQGVGSGTCCVTVLIQEKEMIVSNLGDCRAVLCRGGLAESLTKDHRAENEDERKRIENKGGYVEIHKGAWRVHGILAVARSIGDAHLKEWVVAEPDTKILDLTPDMDFLVLASDGLWDKVGNQEAIDTILKCHAIGKKPGLPEDDLLLLDNQKQRGLKENNDEYICVNSSSPKVKRISLVKQQKVTTLSPSYRKTKNTDIFKDNLCDFDTENESPPAKMRKFSLFQHKNMKIQSPKQENKRPVSRGLVAACKELVNLAVSRGSMDDITVMIVDLNQYKGSKA